MSMSVRPSMGLCRFQWLTEGFDIARRPGFKRRESKKPLAGWGLLMGAQPYHRCPDLFNTGFCKLERTSSAEYPNYHINIIECPIRLEAMLKD